jgi:hypothetical protein
MVVATQRATCGVINPIFGMKEDSKACKRTPDGGFPVEHLWCLDVDDMGTMVGWFI